MASPARAVEALRSPRAAGAAARAVEALLARMPRRAFAVRLWDGTAVPPTRGARAAFTVVLPRPDSPWRLLWPPGELTVAEAFVRGDVEVEGDLVAAVATAGGLRPDAADVLAILRATPSLAAGRPAGAGAAPAPRLRGPRHSRRRDAEAVRYHYDVGNDFYALWLDRRMVYSCAYFPDPATPLDAAQEAKLELVCRKLRLERGQRLLDVGCGWGGLVTWAAERHGVEALGITVSPSQAELARERIAARGLAARCRVEVADYRELKAGGFDAIASVGMVEHVGVAKLQEYFAQARRLLRPGGAFLNHGISPAEPRDDGLRSRVLREGAFLQRWIFPDTELPFLHETAAAAVDAGLELRDVESLREHYALTLRQWLARLEARGAEAEALVGAPRLRAWRLYLAGAAAAFERCENTVFQALYVRPDGGRSGLPLGRADWYARPLVTRRAPARGARGPGRRRRAG